uniref:Heat shock protein 70 n=1 Tax=Grapevine leafroll-associated virus 7 TaxID=217615 RepID=I7H470_9CLOS|nr:heat shock protein 70 [Grapevine leafroll-associated virus 7]
MVDLGLDFGSTFSTVSALIDDKFVELNMNGSPYIPTEMAIYDDKFLVIGSAAKLVHLKSDKYTIYYDLKRWVGVNSLNFERIREKLKPKYNTIFQDNDCWMDGIGTVRKFLPVKSLIYYYIKNLVELFCEIKSIQPGRLNISVPADYSNLQRGYQKSLLKEIGFSVNQIVNEPSAAAIYSFFTNPDEEDILMYDFGGGTFDVSYVKILNGIMSVIDTSGDLYLGGRDIDNELGKYLTNKTGKVFTPFILAKIKLDVSEDNKSVFDLPDENNESVRFDFNSSELNEIVRPFSQRSLNLLDDVVVRNNIRSCCIVMVGGSSLLSNVYDMVNEYASKHSFSVVRDRNLRLSVSYGCACLFQLQKSNNFTYIDVNSHPLYDVGFDFLPEIVVRKPMPIPYTHSVRKANDTTIQTGINVFEGDKPFLLDADVLVKSTFFTDSVSRPGEGYYLNYRYSVDGDISVDVTSNDGKIKKTFENSVVQEFKLNKLDLIQTQIGIGSEIVVLVDLLKYYSTDEDIQHLDTRYPFLLNAAVEKLGGIGEISRRLRDHLPFV